MPALRRADSLTSKARRCREASVPGDAGDLVSVISALVTPLSPRRPVAVPLTTRALPPGSLGGQNRDTLGTLAMFLAADLPMAHAMTLPLRSTDIKLVCGPSSATVSR